MWGTHVPTTGGWLVTQSKQSQRVQRETRNHSVCQSECHRDQRSHQRYIVTSSLSTKGIVKIHHPSFASLEGTNDLHRYILTEYRRNSEVPSPIFCQPRGNQRWNTSSLHPHWISRESEDPSPILNQPGGNQRWQTTSLHPHWIPRESEDPSPILNQPGGHQWCPHRYILTEYRGKAKIHRPSSASLEGTTMAHEAANINDREKWAPS